MAGGVVWDSETDWDFSKEKNPLLGFEPLIVLTYLPTYSLTYLLTYLLTHLLTYLLAYLLTYLLTYLVYLLT